MKRIAQILVLALFTSCSGDSKYVRFETTQPDGVKESKSFNRKVKGEYVNCSDSGDILIISNNLILNARTFKLKSHRKDLKLDSVNTIDRNVNDELTKLYKSEGYDIDIIGDTISTSRLDIDTVFHISESEVLKKFKGSYFLNFKEDESFWNVGRLSLNKDTLRFGLVAPSDTLLRFDFVVKKVEFDESDSTTTTEYTINPSKKEFKQLIKPNSFEVSACYCKKK